MSRTDTEPTGVARSGLRHRDPPDGGGPDRRALTGGLLAGIGLGGFVDGIVAHQILQWHHMLTDHGEYAGRFPPGSVTDLEANTLADGLFHVLAFAFTVAGILVLHSAARRGRSLPARALAGTLLAGWGVFNVVEGIVDHHILSVHHVRDDVADPLWWDLGFLALGLLLIVAGAALVRSATPGRRSASPT